MKYISLLVLAICWNSIHSQAQSHGQLFHRNAWREETPPSFILVQLVTGQNKLAYAKSIHDEARVATIEKDVAAINLRLVQDFNLHFKFCPVYFFYDTNMVHIIKRDIRGVVLDKNLKPVSLELKDSDTSYFIMQYSKCYNSIRNNDFSIFAKDWRGEPLDQALPVTVYDRFKYKDRKSYYRSGALGLSFNIVALGYSETLATFYRR